ncbi:glyoxalase [Mycobacteriaceae bacterium NPDC060252]
MTPTPSLTRSQLILSPVGTLSVFEFLTPVPAPFGTERSGWLVTDLDAAVTHARNSGASVVVDPFTDPIGRDVVVQFPGGVNTQLYWHTAAPSYQPLRTIPDYRAYVPVDAVDTFLASYRSFTGATVDSDEANADGALIGKPSTTFRLIRLGSRFGNTTVLVTNGQLPFPYGHEVAGYAVADVAATVRTAANSGATVLVPVSSDGSRAMLQFPGGYIAEVHGA